MLTKEIISILVNSLIFVIFISFQDTESIPWSFACMIIAAYKYI